MRRGPGFHITPRERDVRAADAYIRRFPRRARPGVERELREVAKDFRRVVRIGAFAVSQRIGQTVRAEAFRTFGRSVFGWRVIAGGRYRGVDAFFAHMTDKGTKAGFRRYRSRARKQRGRPGFYHPGTPATGFQTGAYRIRKREYMRRIRTSIRVGLRGR